MTKLICFDCQYFDGKQFGSKACTIGAKLGDITIAKAMLAGVESYGMCCSAREIGISDDHNGIIDLGDDTDIGVDLKEILPIERLG